ncbi:uncharacterized protein NFIA_092490 [Aspergillus fischeri NRRL 181]|uniref:Uncharacterized protein n=1 Tax=Neosartorya fischeri (strain ATCC 1020 / DSM 3700 / CBS 544.65 / FGSC A1164 / JCM 1740 / NRRL 181 / WB 181) TaxID=331117 RepID=A1DIT1_NEOFI|nr:uncharacterized protein NFIA_092490 [Aspergillus fischeri NRRL 181]EAW19288.1 hypothetical protein NFIA_092490 [Aspergillus fischeri NRRL 181]
MASIGGRGQLARATRRELGAMFRYSVDPMAPGGSCSDYGQETLDAMFDDAYQLAGTAIQATLDHEDATAATTNEATHRMHGVMNWMESGGRTNNGLNKRRPYLFCGDTWRVRETMSSQMKDAEGNPMVKENGEPYLIQDSKAMKTRRKEVAEQLKKSTKHIYPYWSQATLTYTFAVKYDEDPTLGPCKTEAGAIGYTITEKSFGAIILCHTAFNGRRLRSVAASAFASSFFETGQPPSDKGKVQEISEVVPAGRVAYHELLHLYWGSVMNEGGNEEYSFQRMAGNKLRKNGKMYTKSLAMENPETYALAAVAYDYTLHVTHTTKPGKTYPVEFYTGFCTYEE